MSERCSVDVDGRYGLSIAHDRDSGRIDVLEFARESSLELKNPKSGTIDMVESIAIADDGAIMSIPCRRNGETYLVTTVKVGTPGEDSEGSTGQRKAIEEFLRFYIPELVKLKCGG